jgi:thymidylate synthase (FAD)
MTEVKPKVKLISYTKNPEALVASAIRQCYSKIGASELLKKIPKEKIERLIAQVSKSGHTSTIEHASFTFAIEGISRACSHELVRHRIASFSQQSQRYVKPEEGFNFIVPAKIKANKELYKKFITHMKQSNKLYGEFLKAEIPPEDARFVLPNACETKIVVTMNARSLFNFFQRRLCLRAQWEIRQMAFLMYQEVMKVAPNIFRHAGPTCETEGICWEGKLACPKAHKLKRIEIRERK